MNSLAVLVPGRGPGTALACTLGGCGNRRSRYQTAAGSAGEVRVGLLAAVGWGYLRDGDAEAALAQLDRLLASLWKLTH